jgi:hypothetical protein
MSDEELSLRHRRVSEAAAGAPSGATRAVIRREAEAQAAARRAKESVPVAANDSHWPLRAVAGLAVIVIAAGLWWQMRPPAATATGVAEIEQSAAMQASSPTPSAAVPSAAEAVVESRATAKVRAEPRAPSANGAVRAVPPASADAMHAISAEPLAKAVARRLPAAWHSSTPVAGLWVRLDARGQVVDAGRTVNEEPMARAAGAAIREQAATPEYAAAREETANRADSAAQPGDATAASAVELVNARGVPLRIRILREPVRP